MSAPQGAAGYDAAAFQAFEGAGWNEVADVYAELTEGMGLTTGAAADAILAAAGVHGGQSTGPVNQLDVLDVLDVATGPGFLAAAAAARGARVIGVDIAPAMVDHAARRHPTVEFRVGPAEALPIPDGSTDVVVSAWGLPHFADHAAVFAEARRVLRAGGRLAMGTWVGPPRNRFFAVLLGALTAELVVMPDLPPGPDLFRYADPAVARAELAAAGFEQVRVSPLVFEAGLPGGGADLVRFLSSGSVRSRALFDAQPAEVRERIAASLRAGVAEGSTLHLEAVVISAVRP
ncbi:MAG: class I SAM-dependent methyltransferase [Vicinamibacterales bacterium]